jgi:hypothetical protein
MYDFSMREPGPRRLYHDPVHFNVCLKGGGLESRIGARNIKGRDPKQIEWIWIVELNRHATDEEIKQLCKGTWK